MALSIVAAIFMASLSFNQFFGSMDTEILPADKASHNIRPARYEPLYFRILIVGRASTTCPGAIGHYEAYS
ncbi:uncharacterized protein MELLADRAFT_124524 [Melampsora larici-populina 98AG31]|uniref:Secreted protein n=1 Tax=Melampsora larici-populina (strain 98AG31 / pathotype 3-4-7) TaxID=747676 RepID=F4RDK8_MELLP|nr:uncharacterized protein MELLADRAFT_124524 [Melampsora larici-populina 98AG31]EGG09592.1 secreted protein [Melampsora larici-populina 98AG31]